MIEWKMLIILLPVALLFVSVVYLWWRLWLLDKFTIAITELLVKEIDELKMEVKNNA